MISRRTLLAGAAVVPLAGCATPGTPPPSVDIIQQIIDTVQAYAAAVCGIIPTARSILDILAGFGVPLAGVTAIALQTVEQAICQAAPPPASARYKALPRRSLRAAPGIIGNAPTPKGDVVVKGWRT